MPAHLRDRDELLANLQEQQAMLVASARGYDDGCFWEAKRMATHADTLLHTRGRSIALLEQLKLLSEVQFVNSSRGLSGMKPDTPLLTITLTQDTVSYSQLCQSLAAPPWLSFLRFRKWWEEPIYRDNNGKAYSRKNLICSLRDQDGGSHLDASLKDQEYVSMKTAGFPQVGVINAKGTPSAVPNAHLATMRQIAWEVLESLKRVNSA